MNAIADRMRRGAAALPIAGVLALACIQPFACQAIAFKDSARNFYGTLEFAGNNDGSKRAATAIGCCRSLEKLM